MVCRATILAISATLLARPAALSAQTIVSPAEVIDGDTLSLTGTRIRLLGIDAPELRQTCEREGKTWDCGREAKAALEQLIEGQNVSCTGSEHDRYGRLLARCSVGSNDLAEDMVLAGMAITSPEYAEDYAETEARARQLGQGIWSGAFDVPSEWRSAHPEASSAPPSSRAQTAAAPARPTVWRDNLGRCAIKGNHSRKGEWIYHLPGQAYYEQTRPEARFCTEGDALSAGYRPSKV